MANVSITLCMCCLSLFGVLVFTFDAIIINNNEPATCLNLFDTRRQNANQQLNFLAGGTTTKEVASQLNRADHFIHSRESVISAPGRKMGCGDLAVSQRSTTITFTLSTLPWSLTFRGPRLFSFGKDPRGYPG